MKHLLIAFFSWFLLSCQSVDYGEKTYIFALPANVSDQDIADEEQKKFQQKTSEDLKKQSELFAKEQVRIKNKVKEAKKNLLESFNRRGLALRDIPSGESRVSLISKQIKSQDYLAAASLIEALKDDTKSLTVDEKFISAKNERLLKALSSHTLSDDQRQKIDQHSMKIDKLLEKQDYISINRELNKIFDLFE